MNIKKNKPVLALSIIGLGVVLLAVISQTFKNDEPSVPYMLIYEDAKIVNRAVKLIYSSNLDSAKILLEEVIRKIGQTGKKIPSITIYPICPRSSASNSLIFL